MGKSNISYYKSYAKLAKHRNIVLSSVVDTEAAEVISAFLIYYDNENQEEDINFYIKTDGGSVSSFFHIYDVMKMIKAPIKTINMGKCYSAGSILLSSGTPGKRYGLAHSEVMMHGIQLLFPLVTDNIKNNDYMKFIKSKNDKLLQILSNNTGQSFDKIKEDSKRDLFLDANEAKKYGFIDHIL